MMFSSLTTKRTYAAVGIFMFFFTLTIVSGIFSESNINWQFLGPGNVLNYWYDMIFGVPLPEGLSSAGIAIIIPLLVPPLIVTYWRIFRRGLANDRPDDLANALSKWYGEVIGLNSFNLEIEKGITGIVGPNGSGKSTSSNW